MNVAIVVAAGSGERLGSDVPKALVPLAGRPLLSHALDRLARSGAVDHTIVVFAPGHREAFEEVCRSHGVGALVAGGDTRTGSVRAGAAELDAAAELVAVHDAARALTPPEVIAATFRAVTGDVVAAAPGLAVADTLKRVDDGTVSTTLDRTDVWAVHTPQVIRADVLRATLAWAPDGVATDDLGLVERAREAGVVSGKVALVEGDVRGLKVTYPRDLELAAILLAAEDRPRAPDETEASP